MFCDAMPCKRDLPLPDPACWSFSDIRDVDAQRAAALECVGSADDLVDAVQSAFRSALGQPGAVRFGHERADDKPNDVRAVVQFPVGAALFDWFFNGRTGYRAHFYVDHKFGQAFNDRVVEALLTVLKEQLPEAVDARDIGPEFSDRGPVQVSKDFLVRSLGSGVSKVWMCTLRIGHGGCIDRLPHGAVGQPKLFLRDDRAWPAFGQDEEAAWLDLKGGFVGSSAIWQADLSKRAKQLQDTGTI
jgi:hypothetical protein